ncbi:MAG: EscU/YscU/HrcU family type III secretion system export apparatus switch protein [Clostridium sp.]
MEEKKRKKAAALKYEYGQNAPKVTAAGMGNVAEKILQEAEKSEVPIVYNEELADMLTKVDIDSEIPHELYEVVAKVIAYIMEVDNKCK